MTTDRTGDTDDAALADDQPPFLDVDVIGQDAFELGHKLAEGGQASVYLARELSDTGRQVAVKIIECAMNELHAKQPSVLERFRSEIRTWKHFSTSSFVVNLYYTYRYRVKQMAYFCFVMEYADHGDLSKNISNRSLFGGRRKDLYSFLRRIALGLKEGHDKDISHGDIKPHNILLFKSDGRIIPKIMDFGLGISTSDDVTRFGGTPEYLAPERFGPGGGEGDYIRPKTIEEAKLSDIYSLGVLFYEILCGERPYQAPRHLINRERWFSYGELHHSGKADFDRLSPNGGVELTELVRRMMAVDPQAKTRPPLLEIIRRLERLVQDSSTITAREQECPIAVRTYRWNPAVHSLLESRLYYYFIKGRSPDGDPKWFKNHFEDAGIRFFSFYTILGGYDYVVRVWLKLNYAEEIDKIVKNFKSDAQKEFLKFAVASPFPFEFSDDGNELSFSDENALMASIESCADPRDKEAEFANLRAANLVGSRLADYPSESIRFFLTISVAGTVNEAMLRMYAAEIHKRLKKQTAAEQVSVYIGSGAFQLLVKFRLGRFQDFRKLYEVFRATCDYVRVGDSVLTSQTFVELGEKGMFESDDGTIVSDLVRRLDIEDI